LHRWQYPRVNRATPRNYNVRTIHAALQLFCAASIAHDMSQNASCFYVIDNAAKIPRLPA
jgi:hypothetical protein